VVIRLIGVEASVKLIWKLGNDQDGLRASAHPMDYSSFHKYVELGGYPLDWGGSIGEVDMDAGE